MHNLRRYTPEVTILSVRQVNIGAQQVNMANPQQQNT
jgi:hypothetical protein